MSSMVENGPCGGHQWKNTRMTRGVIFLALPGAWNDQCTIVMYQRNVRNTTSTRMRSDTWCLRCNDPEVLGF